MQQPPYGYQGPYQPAPQVVYAMPPPWICPSCRQASRPILTQPVSGVGWLVFVVLFCLCVTIPICWIGFLLGEERWRCEACRAPVAR